MSKQPKYETEAQLQQSTENLEMARIKNLQKNKMKDVTNPIIGYLNKRTFIILNLRATNYLSDTICIDL